MDLNVINWHFYNSPLTSQLEQTQVCSSCDPPESACKMSSQLSFPGMGCYLQHKRSL